MKLIDEPAKRSTGAPDTGRKKLLKRAINLAAIVSLVVIGFLLKECVVSVWPIINEPRYIYQHLDRDAVRPGDSRLRGGQALGVRYRDVNGDHDFHSILLWRNTQGYIEDIPVRTGPGGALEYPDLLPHAVKPDEAIRTHMRIDYIWTQTGHLDSVPGKPSDRPRHGPAITIEPDH